MTNDLKNSLTQTLFWDVNIEDIDVEIHSSFIVERVLTRGTLEDFKFINSFYKKERIKEIIVNIKNLDDKVLSFCVAYFIIPKTKFRCYKFKQSNQKHWNY
jgi:hypothetical protein